MAEAEPFRVLFVDDEPLALRVVERIFEAESDFAVSVTTDPNEAISLASTTPFDLVVADQRMPTMQGLQMLARMREVAPHTIRILLTGYPDVSIALEGINKGLLHRLMLKPWDADEMIRTIRGEVSRKRGADRDRLMGEHLRAWFDAIMQSERASVADAAGHVPPASGRDVAGAVELPARPWDLNDVVRLVVDLMRSRFGGESPRLDLTPLPFVDAHGEQVVAILYHLVSNALDFTPAPRRGDILIRTFRERRIALIEVVSPLGPLRAEVEQKLFSRFSTRRGGLGLGLFTAQKRADKLQGRLVLSRNDADGVGFCLEVPLWSSSVRPPSSRRPGAA